jgi:hypothetical protein
MGGVGLLELLPAVVGDVADAPEGAPAHHEVAQLQAAVLDQDVGHIAAALFGTRLDDRAAGPGPVEVGLQVQHLGSA